MVVVVILLFCNLLVFICYYNHVAHRLRNNKQTQPTKKKKNALLKFRSFTFFICFVSVFACISFSGSNHLRRTSIRKQL